MDDRALKKITDHQIAKDDDSEPFYEVGN